MNKLKVIPFNKDEAPEVARVTIPVVRESLGAQGIDADKAAQVYMRMWADGSAKLVHQIDSASNQVVGVGILMITPSLIYSTDGLVVLLAPSNAPGDGDEMIRFLENVAVANGCGGISITLPSTPTSFRYIDTLTSDGWSAKSVIYGKGLT